MQLCELTSAINHGSVIQLIFKNIETEAPVIVTGDHRPIRAFLEDWDAEGRPLVEVSDDGETLSLN